MTHKTIFVSHILVAKEMCFHKKKIIMIVSIAGILKHFQCIQ